MPIVVLIPGGADTVAPVVPLSIDGTPVHATGSSITIAGTITTTKSNNIIIVFITTNGGPVTGVSGGGLTWAQRATNGLTTTGIMEWWALAPSPLSGVTITVSLTSALFNTIDIFAVNGAKTSAPFDVNASLPAISQVDPILVSTTAANTMILGNFRDGGTSTAGAGFTLIGGTNFQLSEYQIVSAAQTNLSVTMGTGAGTAAGAIGDAIVQGP